MGRGARQDLIDRGQFSASTVAHDHDHDDHHDRDDEE